jgi:hypothetical protein
MRVFLKLLKVLTGILAVFVLLLIGLVIYVLAVSTLKPPSVDMSVFNSLEVNRYSEHRYSLSTKPPLSI